ncbi:MAG: hypothetical protein QME79_07620 [Bacillota bacterium]|nr:hypothetical protein [Bacillota bacterium]
MTRNTPFTKDWLLLGMATGMAASAAKSLVNYALDRTRVPTIQHGTLAGNIVMGKRERLGGLLPGGAPRTSGERAAGYLADTIAGAACGVALSYVYAKTPPGNETIKGILGGAVMGTVTLALGNQLRVKGFRNLSPGQVTSMLATSALFGGLEGWVIGRYGAKLAPQSHPLPVKNVTDRECEQGRLAPAGRAARPLDAGLSPTLY